MVHIPGLYHLTEVRRRFGLAAGLRGLFYRVFRRALQLRVDRIVCIETSAAVPLNDAELELRFLNADDVREFACDPDNELDESFAERLESRLDLCFAAIADGELVNYSWYAIDSIEAEHCSLTPVSFPAGVAYFYKSYTHPHYRGRGINQLAIRHALANLAQRGIERVFGVVELDNWPSLRSCTHIGFRRLGWLVSVGWGRRLVWPARWALKLGMRFGLDAQVVNRHAAAPEAMTFAMAGE